MTPFFYDVAYHTALIVVLSLPWNSWHLAELLKTQLSVLFNLFELNMKTINIYAFFSVVDKLLLNSINLFSTVPVKATPATVLICTAMSKFDQSKQNLIQTNEEEFIMHSLCLSAIKFAIE